MTGKEKQERIDRLAKLSRLVLDVALSEVERAARARAESRDLLAGLASASAPAELATIAGARAELRYQQWAEARRAEINVILARQTAEWMQAREAARHAFGRAEVLRELSRRR
jgi:hypothetical protein